MGGRRGRPLHSTGGALSIGDLALCNVVDQFGRRFYDADSTPKGIEKRGHRANFRRRRMAMKKRTPILLAVAVPAVAVVALMGGAGASAGTPNLIQVKVGDSVDVLNTRVACFALTSNGKTGIGCLIWSKKNAPLVGSYGVGLTVDGTAVLNRIKADGSAQNLFKKRLLASDGAAGTVYKVKLGEGFGLPAPNGRVLGCQVLNITSTAVAPIYRGLKVSCWLATATKPVPNRYGVSISDKLAGVFKFTPKGALSSWGIAKPQPRG